MRAVWEESGRSKAQDCQVGAQVSLTANWSCPSHPQGCGGRCLCGVVILGLTTGVQNLLYNTALPPTLPESAFRPKLSCWWNTITLGKKKIVYMS